jgi:thioredoxin 1
MKHHSHIIRSLVFSCIVIAIAIFVTPRLHTSFARQPDTKIVLLTNSSDQTNPVTVLKNSFKEQVLMSMKPVIVYFFAEWCPSCQEMKPIFNQVAGIIPDVQFIVIDVDEWEELADTYTIQSMPSFLFFNKGKLINRTTGFMNKKKLIEFIEQNKATLQRTKN